MKEPSEKISRRQLAKGLAAGAVGVGLVGLTQRTEAAPPKPDDGVDAVQAQLTVALDEKLRQMTKRQVQGVREVGAARWKFKIADSSVEPSTIFQAVKETK